MGESVTDKQLKKFRKNFANDPAAKVAQNAVTNGNLIDVALNRDLVQAIDSSFSIKLDDWKVTNQKSSGRCWLFATLNLFRPGTMKKLNVKNFEFSQSHIHFCTKSLFNATSSRFPLLTAFCATLAARSSAKLILNCFSCLFVTDSPIGSPSLSLVVY